MFGWTTFGKVKYNDEIYTDDVCVDANGKIKKRKRGENHTVTAGELKPLLTKEVSAVVVGTGQSGCAQVSHDFMDLIDAKKLELHKFESPQAIKTYNEIATTKKTVAIIHITC